MRTLSALLLVFSTVLVTALPAHAQVGVNFKKVEPIPPQPSRPKVALVLSGGGARGFAHIGVLRVLKEMNIPVDIVVGNSMGAVVGGAYASGRTVEQMEELVRSIPWDSVIADRPARDSLTFRRREDDVLFPSRIELGVTSKGILLPPSAAGNSALELALSRIIPFGMRDAKINELPLPFRSAASDLLTGDMVELIDTPLFTTMRASLSVPGLFSPIRLNGRLVVDGALVRNLPIDLALKMGADIIIAVNVGTPLAKENEISSALDVAQQMLQILGEQNVNASIKQLRPQDILITPDLSHVSALDFNNFHTAIESGDAGARAKWLELSKLSIDPALYAQIESKRSGATPSKDRALPVAHLDVQSKHMENPDILLARTGLKVGAVLTEEQIRDAANKLYGRGDVVRVNTDITEENNERSVVIRPTEATWARSRARIALELSNDFKDENQFSIGVMHVATALNTWGAESRTQLKIGSQQKFSSELFQPLGVGSPWYFSPSLDYTSAIVNYYADGKKLARYGYKRAYISTAVGRQINDWGDVQIGIQRQLGRASVIVPQTNEISPFDSYSTTQFTQFRIDTIDVLAFPTKGYVLNVNLQRTLGQNNEKPLTSSTLVGLSAFSRGAWAGHMYGEWAKDRTGIAQLPLGGFLRLSGTPTNSIDATALGRVVIARRIGNIPSALGGAIRLGFSAELGGGFSEKKSINYGKLKQAGSAFVALDTRFGPLYFGAGATRGNGSTLYVFLGPIW
jgi:NTE family protein